MVAQAFGINSNYVSIKPKFVSFTLLSDMWEIVKYMFCVSLIDIVDFTSSYFKLLGLLVTKNINNSVGTLILKQESFLYKGKFHN